MPAFNPQHNLELFHGFYPLKLGTAVSRYLTLFSCFLLGQKSSYPQLVITVMDPKYFIELLMRDATLQLSVLHFERPIQQASHFSTFVCSDENSPNFLIILKSLLSDSLFLTKMLCHLQMQTA